MNYQDELAKMKPSQLKFVYDTIQSASIANSISGKWRDVFMSARNRTISPRVRSLLTAFIKLDNIESATNAFMSVSVDFKGRKNV